jgi:DNA-directed RNA polymerase specialized sigma subunit
MKIASSMLTEIKSRSIDKLQDIEDEILTTRKLAGENRQDLVNVLGISSSEKTQFEDKIRVLIMMILCLKDMAEL